MCRGGESNTRRQPLQGCALPLSYRGICPREESNLDLLLRRESFYPLNYGDKIKNRITKSALQVNPSRSTIKKSLAGCSIQAVYPPPFSTESSIVVVYVFWEHEARVRFSALRFLFSHDNSKR